MNDWLNNTVATPELKQPWIVCRNSFSTLIALCTIRRWISFISSWICALQLTVFTEQFNSSARQRWPKVAKPTIDWSSYIAWLRPSSSTLFAIETNTLVLLHFANKLRQISVSFINCLVLLVVSPAWVTSPMLFAQCIQIKVRLNSCAMPVKKI
jgi:hypothetical protein